MSEEQSHSHALFFSDVPSEVEHLAAIALGRPWQRRSISATMDYSGAAADKQKQITMSVKIQLREVFFFLLRGRITVLTLSKIFRL